MILQGRKFQEWIKDLISSLAYENLTLKELSKKHNKSVGVINRWKNNDIVVSEVANLKDEIRDNYKERLSKLADKAFEVYEDLITDPNSPPAVRLKAAEMILKTNGIVTDKTEIKHSGEVSLPVINIITSVEE